MLNLVDFRVIEQSTRIVDLPDFDYVRVVFFNAVPTMNYAEYSILKPIYLQLLIEIDGLVTAYGKVVSANKNPSLVFFDKPPIDILGIDVTGKFPCYLYFYEIVV